MMCLGEPRVIEDGAKISVYQIISTSHIIIHAHPGGVHADLFSCEPFDMDRCAGMLLDHFGETSAIQYCQRNLFTSTEHINVLPMVRMNALTSNPRSLTHALVNWYGGKESLISDPEYGKSVIERAVGCLSDTADSPRSSVKLIDVAPVPGSWDQGGFSGGYVNILRQLTLHTFRGINGAYMDVMARRFDLEKILAIIQKGFDFRFYEVDAIFQRGLSPVRMAPTGSEACCG